MATTSDLPNWATQDLDVVLDMLDFLNPLEETVGDWRSAVALAAAGRGDFPPELVLLGGRVRLVAPKPGGSSATSYVDGDFTREEMVFVEWLLQGAPRRPALRVPKSFAVGSLG